MKWFYIVIQIDDEVSDLDDDLATTRIFQRVLKDH
jgi:hypothetical protein